MSSRFDVGDRVTKIQGYRFSGEVVSVFLALPIVGRDRPDFERRRYCVQNVDGIIHIFNGGQLLMAD